MDFLMKNSPSTAEKKSEFQLSILMPHIPSLSKVWNGSMRLWKLV